MTKDIKKITKKILGQKTTVLFVMIWITLALYLSPVWISQFTDIADIIMIVSPLCGISGLAFFCITFIYFGITSPVKKSLKTLVRTGKIDYIDEIISRDYNSNGVVCFSKHFLYDIKTHAIVAYDDIVWIYEYQTNASSSVFLICTIDGKKHKSKIDKQTLSEFLKRRRGILLGNTPQNKTLYKQKVNEFTLN